jgi:hypothetical protein
MTTDHDLASAASWRKSSHSNQNGSCIEVGRTPAGNIAVRDTTDRGGPVLRVRPAAWRALAAVIGDGRALRD